MKYEGCFGSFGGAPLQIRSPLLVGRNSGTNQEPITEGKDGRSPLHRAAASPLQYRGNDAAVHPLRRNHYKFVMNSKTNF